MPKVEKLRKLASVYVLSDEAVNHKNDDFIPPSMYADPINKRYPMNTKEACEVSMAEFMYDNRGNTAIPADTRHALDKAASVYGIDWPNKRETAMVKLSAMTSTGDMLVLDFPDNAAGASKAMSAIMDIRNKSEYVPCMELAKGVVKQAFKHDCDIPDEVMRLAGYCAGDKEAVLNAISKRANKVGNSDIDNRMHDYMEEVMNTPGDIIPPEDLTKIAEVLDAYDGLNESRGYNTYNTAPEQEIFTKSAFDLVTALEDELHIPSVDAIVSKSDLIKNASIAISALSDMGIACSEDNLIDTVTKLNHKQATYLFGELE